MNCLRRPPKQSKVQKLRAGIKKPQLRGYLAVGVGFEPTEHFNTRQFSKLLL